MGCVNGATAEVAVSVRFLLFCLIMRTPTCHVLSAVSLVDSLARKILILLLFSQFTFVLDFPFPLFFHLLLLCLRLA